jgi:hypothetical protein
VHCAENKKQAGPPDVLMLNAVSLASRLGLELTTEYGIYLDGIVAKFTEVDLDIFDTSLTMLQRHLGPCDSNRHVFVRNVAHGFHQGVRDSGISPGKRTL